MLRGRAAESLNAAFITRRLPPSVWLTHITHTSASFFFLPSPSLLSNFGYLCLSSVCISVSLTRSISHTHTHTHTHTERRRRSALWQPVSSVNDLWRVSRCVSLGSFRFVSTALYLRAPFMGPQVWRPSPLGGRKSRGGDLPNSPHSLHGGQWWKAHEHDWAMLKSGVQAVQGVERCKKNIF